MVKPNEKLQGYVINPITNEKIPLYLKEDDKFGELNANGTPCVDSKLGRLVLNSYNISIPN